MRYQRRCCPRAVRWWPFLIVAFCAAGCDGQPNATAAFSATAAMLRDFLIAFGRSALAAFIL